MTNLGNSKQKASPATRKLAKALGIDLSQIEGSGENGRIEAADLERYLNDRKRLEENNIENISIKSSKEDEELKILEQRINMINDEVEDKTADNTKIYSSSETDEEMEELNNADSDIIQFMIKHQNDIYDEDNSSKDIIVNYDQTSSIITSEVKEEANDKEENEEIHDTKDTIEKMNKAENAKEAYTPVIEEVVSKEYDDEGNEIPVVPVENSVTHQVIVPAEHSEISEEYPDTEREVNESYGKRVVITLNDDTSRSVVINKDGKSSEEKTVSDQSQLVIETHTHNVVTMGIKASLELVKEMLVSYSDLSERKIFNTVVKSIVFALEKNKITSFKGDVAIYKYDSEEGFTGRKLSGINELTVSQMDKRMKYIIEGEDIDFRITDISPLKIDYYYPRACEEKVDITVLIQDEHVKVYLSACEDLMDFNECAKVLSNIKSVINNPSLMLV